MIIDHNHPEYIKARRRVGKGKFNGCYYYSKEIVENIIPNVKTDRPWNTIGMQCCGIEPHSIVFLHDNATSWRYKWLAEHKDKDLILVCSSEYTALSVKWFGKTILLPMSIDTEYVKKFAVKEKNKDTCFVGNAWVEDYLRDENKKGILHADRLCSMSRTKLLRELAKYKKAYAIDRCALEAKTLGCELLSLGTRYSVDNVGQVLDNREAARIFQQKLDDIGG